MSLRPINHGTLGGHRAHQRRGEPMCEPCRDAHRAYYGRSPFQPAQHGTRSGYNRHRLDGEPACEPCKAAVRDAARSRRAHALPH